MLDKLKKIKQFIEDSTPEELADIYNKSVEANMSGGTHDYFCFKVDSFIDSLEEFSEREFTGSYVKENKLRNAFIEHMKEVANVARIIEWVDSGDKSEGEEFEPIRKLLKLESK